MAGRSCRARRCGCRNSGVVRESLVAFFFFFAQFLLLAPNLSLPIFYSIFRIKEVLFFLSCLFIDFRCFKVKTRSCFFLSMIALSRKEIATRRKKKRNFKSALPRFWAGSQLLH